MEPSWIEEPTVIALHGDQLKEFGGLAGIRDRGLLLSAVARPLNVWAYTTPKPDVIRLAASYAYGIAKNHPFFDGNKRTSLIACLTFLKLNGWQLTANQSDRVRIILALASGSIGEEELEVWLRTHVSPLA